MLRQSGAPLRLLTRQFRMNREICRLVSDSFYDGRLITDETSGTARLPEFVMGGLYIAGLFWLDYTNRPPTHKLEENGLGLLEVRRVSKTDIAKDPALGKCEEYEQAVYNSFANATEIAHIVEGLELFLDSNLFVPGPQGKIVAVVTFYKQQAEILLATLEASRYAKDFAYAMEMNVLRVQTVDSSQGSEADIVILSGVRSNAEKNVGFLGTANGSKRLCVGLSRARQTLIIVGDQRTLAAPGSKLAFASLWSPGGKVGEMMPNVDSGVKLLRAFGDLARSMRGSRAREADFEAVGDMFGATLMPTQILTARGPLPPRPGTPESLLAEHAGIDVVSNFDAVSQAPTVGGDTASNFDSASNFEPIAEDDFM